MHQFSLGLEGGRKLTGRLSIPNKPQISVSSLPLPLVICIHGGSYDSEYFDIDPQHSIFVLGELLQIPIVAIDRPGYGGSTAYPDPKIRNEDLDRQGTTFAQEQGKYLHSIVLPALWKEFGPKSSASSMIILAHSIGGMMAVVAAASFTDANTKKYPLSGMVISGIGCKSHMHESPGPKNGDHGNKNGQQGDGEKTHIFFDPTVKDTLMINFPPKADQALLIDSKVPSYTEALNKPVPLGELQDVRTTWQTYWRSYAERVSVPLLYAVGGHDVFWDSSERSIAQFTDVFRTKSPRVESIVVRMAPHCIEMSLQGKAWLLRCLGFAVECTMAQKLEQETGKSSMQ
ncbi:Alpha/Beta hydrolase protein [Aspergillus leporis]|jgi:pimeloyl-ACP methyl ester carboxylesterase|uniref:Alpha/Beta hydrolase protein n=1 Tax=Aspergillus leporis TaxID=41062 RepID=A0A5N5XED5_9EURO|nr:Alpha/Beta hydrolase protein [Aspergillus leporis]